MTHASKIAAVAGALAFGFSTFSAVPALAQAKPDIKLGLVAGLSGGGASYGAGIEQGLKMAIGEINAAGGLNGRKISLDVADDGSDPAQSVIAMQRLVNDKVDLVIGGWGSSQVLANMAVAERAGIPYIVVGASNPRITTDKNKWTFRTLTNDDGHSDRLAQVALDLLHFKKIAIIYDTNDYGVGLRDIFVADLGKAGLKPVVMESYQTNDKDFTAQLTHVEAADPQALMLFGTLPAIAAIMNQARDIGVDARFMGAAGLSNEAVMKLSPQASQHAIATAYFFPKIDNQAEAWTKRYETEFAHANQAPRPSQAAPAYEALKLIAAPCLAKVDTDKDKLRQCIADWHGHLFGLPVAEEHFDKTGQLIAPLVVEQVDGKTFSLLPDANN